MLWLALHFPCLALEALPCRQSPSAVVQRGRIAACDPEAAQAGVLPGQKRSTALGLQPGLRLFERDAQREAAALSALACWAGGFTPTVSLAPAAVLLEIGGCLRLFGGLPALLKAVCEGCAGQGWTMRWALAPTPLGARWLAQAGADSVFADHAALHAGLDALSCDVPGWGGAVLNRLQAFGIRHLGDLARLPSAGLRLRLGDAPVDDCLRARGELPDPQVCFVFPEVFASRLELPSRVEHAEGLAFAGQRLLAALAGWLQVRQLLVRVCTVHLTHDDGSDSQLLLRPGEATADESRLLRLLREHLGRWQLRGPVEALALSADEVVARPGASDVLFAQAVAGEGVLDCLARLQARLGEEAVQVLGVRAEHRPECASTLRDPHSISLQKPLASKPDFQHLVASTANLAVTRPLWLLPEPQPLAERADGPHWHGPLQLLTRPERLESGWWDSGEKGMAGDVRRDYCVARNRQGQWAWIFRDAHGWFLHGLFA